LKQHKEAGVELKLPSACYSLCLVCRHLRIVDDYGPACAAFPRGIPEALLDGNADHRRAYPGDRGIRFEAVWRAPKEELAQVQGLDRGLNEAP